MGICQVNNQQKKPVIASMNQKGGVGKTLCVGLLAEWFALIRKKRVLVIDLDMQCNTTDQWVGMEDVPNVVGGQLPPRHPEYNPEWGVNERSTIADIFYGKPVLPYASWLTEQVGKGGFVELMCGHPQWLEEVNIEFNQTDGQLDERVHNRLHSFLSSEEVQAEYDVILLDTGPSRNPIFRAAMRAASDVLVPFKPEEKDIQGINSMLQVIRQENYSRAKAVIPLSLIGLLPNMVRPTKLHENNLSNMLTLHESIVFPKPAWLSHLTAFPERDVKGIRPKSVFEFSKKNPARVQAVAMCQYVEKKLDRK